MPLRVLAGIRDLIGAWPSASSLSCPSARAAHAVSTTPRTREGRAGVSAPGIAVIGKVDTHTDTHQAAVIDSVGRHLDTQSFETTAAGYGQLLTCLRAQDDALAIGMEGTGAYGAELARFLTASGITVVEASARCAWSARARSKPAPRP
ncbi:IS110 family transposase [Streptomyces flaveolus]|uniref:IS110 family transposase n=1 Tax=Streptomyces flaveolus TaxID=67297 RepID=UPI0033264BE1